MRIERGSGIALWRQIEDALAADIAAKRFQDRLPIETELADYFGVNRHTIRRAVQGLESRGLVRIEQGRGTFIQDQMIGYRLGRKTRLSHSLEKQQLIGQSKILKVRALHASDDVAAMLEIPPQSQVLQIDANDVVDGRIIGVCTQYYPLPRFNGFDACYADNGSTDAALQAFGITRYTKKLTRVTARLPKPQQALQLAQSKSQPVLYVENVYMDEQGTPIEYGISRFAADAVQLLFEPQDE